MKLKKTIALSWIINHYYVINHRVVIFPGKLVSKREKKFLQEILTFLSRIFSQEKIKISRVNFFFLETFCLEKNSKKTRNR